jgi:hypothetical protein
MRLVVMLAMTALTACASEEDRAQREAVAERQAVERDAKELVRSRLRDPASAQFSIIRVSGSTVCGTVNSKNGFGGYAGAEGFVVSGGDLYLQSETGDRWAQVSAIACG